MKLDHTTNKKVLLIGTSLRIIPCISLICICALVFSSLISIMIVSGGSSSSTTNQESLNQHRIPPSIESRFRLTNPYQLELDDLFITVKTSFNYHKSRLPIILKTWFTLARQNIWFITDNQDPELNRQTSKIIIIFYFFGIFLK